MCTHIYHSDSNKKCPYPAIYQQLHKAKGTKKLPASLKNFDFTFSKDAVGCCLFHSNNAQFKSDHSMLSQFKLLTEALKWGTKQGVLDIAVYDFDDFIFYGIEQCLDEREDGEKMLLIDLSELSFQECTTFQHAVFYHPTWLSYGNFLKISKFDHAVFHDSADFSDTSFSMNISFNDCAFKKGVSYRGSIFNAAASFERCFLGNGTGFHTSIFKGYVSFTKSKFLDTFITAASFVRPDNNTMINFKAASFETILRIEKTEFTGEVDFTDCQFNQAELVDVKFSLDKMVLLDNIQVKNKLVFKSLDSNKKTFNHLVSLDISTKKIKGEILFENANIYFIKQSALLKKLSQPSVKKIIFGPGCDKYKLKKEFAIPLKKEWHFLVKEMGETFAAFFNWEDNFQIAISVECEYSENDVLVRYFADADLEQPAFEQALAERAPVFYAFLKNPGVFMAEYFKSGKHNSQPTAEDIDIYRRVQSLKLGVEARICIPGSNWGPEETLHLLQSFANNPQMEVAIEFNNYVIKQNDFFSFGNKKLISGGDIRYQEKK